MEPDESHDQPLAHPAFERANPRTDSCHLGKPEDDLQAGLVKELLAGTLKLYDSHLEALDLKIVNRTIRELRHAFRVFQAYRDRRKVSIFGSARTTSDDRNYRLAFEFSRRIVEEGFMVITGGADGIMRAAQEGAGRENSFGVNIMLPFEQGPNATIADDPKLVTFNISSHENDFSERSQCHRIISWRVRNP